MGPAGYLRVISIHAPRAGGDRLFIDRDYRNSISIHAPRAGGDYIIICQRKKVKISIHAPRAGGDATTLFTNRIPADFNPRPPCGGRHRAWGVDCPI